MDTQNVPPISFQTPNTPDPQLNLPSNKSSISKWIIILILIAILLSGGIYFFLNSKSESPNQSDKNPQTSQIPITQSIITSHSPIRWIEYNSELFDIQFQYPEDWKLSLTNKSPFEILEIRDSKYPETVSILFSSPETGHSISIGCSVPDAGYIKGCKQYNKDLEINGNTYKAMFREIVNSEVVDEVHIWDVKTGIKSKYKTFDVSYSSITENFTTINKILSSIH